jgi:hypothetical protein
VEQYYISSEWLLPKWHKSYWMGLVAGSLKSWPRFRWQDGLPAPSNTTYQHWGTMTPQSLLEPNNYERPPELCAVANGSQAYDNPAAWGWADSNCANSFPFMCKRLQPGAYVYNSPTTFSTYMLNTTSASFTDAQGSCNDAGGHLVYFDSLAEQKEVEEYYTGLGVFIPSYHRFYWMGLRTYGWPEFSWLDSAAIQGAYSNWGM